MTVSLSRGMLRLMFFRLWVRAPVISMVFIGCFICFRFPDFNTEQQCRLPHLKAGQHRQTAVRKGALRAD